ncbi:MAG: glycosyltransferase [Wujia sp.]
MKFRLPALASENLKKGMEYLKNNPIGDAIARSRVKKISFGSSYDRWFKQVHEADEEELIRQRETEFAYAPLVSILVPVYMTPELHLRAMLESVINQTYGNWELCLVDGSQAKGELPVIRSTQNTDGDISVIEKVYSLETERIIRSYMEDEPRIHYHKMEINEGIAGNMNVAISISTGEYIALLDHDDILTEDALFQVVQALQEQPYDALYSDEDRLLDNATRFSDPVFKPDFDIDLLRSSNYISHFFVAKRYLMCMDGGFHKEYEGAQDYDMILRCCEAERNVHHIPRVLYHKRVNEERSAAKLLKEEYAKEAGKHALEAHLRRLGLYGIVRDTESSHSYRVVYDTPGNPLLSIVVSGHTDKDLMQKLLEPLYEKARYSSFELIIIDEDNADEELQKYYHKMEAMRRNITVLQAPGNKTKTELRNLGSTKTKGEYILFLDSNAEILDTTALGEMLGICMREDVGIVSGTMYDDKECIFHAGLVLGVKDTYAYVYQGLKKTDPGYELRHRMNCEYSIVADHCLMVKKKVFAQLGGFADKFKTELSNLDFCLRVREHGYRIVQAADAGWYYHDLPELVREARNLQIPEETIYKRETDLFQILWSHVMRQADPYYNPNFDPQGDVFTLPEA